MCVGVCVCVSWWVCEHVCACLYIVKWQTVCNLKRPGALIRLNVCPTKYIYYTKSVCVCVCVWVCGCVCVCLWVCVLCVCVVIKTAI